MPCEAFALLMDSIYSIYVLIIAQNLIRENNYNNMILSAF